MYSPNKRCVILSRKVSNPVSNQNDHLKTGLHKESVRWVIKISISDPDNSNASCFNPE